MPVIFTLYMEQVRNSQNEILSRLRSRIEQHGEADQIEQLCLDGIQINHFTQRISQEIARCNQALYVTFNHCQIKSLENFPQFPEMMGLEIIGNEISGNDVRHLSNCRNLMNLALDQNNIRVIEELRPLNELENLQHLEVRGNPICNIEDYRAKIFEIIPKLKIVDSEDIFGDQDIMLQTQTDSENTDGLLDSEEEEEENDYNFEDEGPRRYRDL